MKAYLGENVDQRAAGRVGISAAVVGGGAGVVGDVLLLVGLLLNRINGRNGLERLGVLRRVEALGVGCGGGSVGGDADIHGMRLGRFGAYSKVVWNA